MGSNRGSVMSVHTDKLHTYRFSHTSIAQKKKKKKKILPLTALLYYFIVCKISFQSNSLIFFLLLSVVFITLMIITVWSLLGVSHMGQTFICDCVFFTGQQWPPVWALWETIWWYWLWQFHWPDGQEERRWDTGKLNHMNDEICF